MSAPSAIFSAPGAGDCPLLPHREGPSGPVPSLLPFRSLGQMSPPHGELKWPHLSALSLSIISHLFMGLLAYSHPHPLKAESQESRVWVSLHSCPPGTSAHPGVSNYLLNE